jgi:uncharacterized protein
VKQRITTFVASGVLALALFGVAAAGPLEDGQAAYQRGDYAAAMQIWRPLADQGNAIAQDLVGSMYGLGSGVPLDYVQAFFWTRKAADQGFSVAQVKLGLLYEYGHGVPQDYVQAHMWYDLAASSAEDDVARNEAAKVRDLVATKMTPAQIAEAQRMASEWMQSHPSKR